MHFSAAESTYHVSITISDTHYDRFCFQEILHAGSESEKNHEKLIYVTWCYIRDSIGLTPYLEIKT